MSNTQKKDRFKKITSARAGKINDMLRLIGNCANKNNYSYSDEEVIKVFEEIEKSLEEAKSKYEVFSRSSLREGFRADFEMGYTWIAGFERNAVRFAKRNALVYPKTGEVWNYAELNAEANRLANAMIRQGIKRGDRVMYQMNNCPEFVFIYIACQKIGAVGCPVYMGLSPSQTASAIDAAKPQIIFYENNGDTELAIETAAHKPRFPVIVNFPHDRKILGGHISYESFTEGAKDSAPSESEVCIYDETTLFYTSGTTGRPKCVPVTSINEVLSAHDMMIQIGLGCEDRILNIASWTHRGGLHCGGPAAALYAGAALIVQDSFEASQSLECIEKYKVTVTAGMPSAFNMLAAAQEKEDRNLASLRCIVSVGGMLGREECLMYRQTLCPKLYNGYGTTETFYNTILTPDKLPFYSGSVGTACADDDVRLVKIYDDHDAEPEETVAKDNETQGEIIIKSLAKSSGHYCKGADGGGSRYYKGYLYTRDIGTWDENGMITIVGRNDDMIICGDEKIYPAEIEEFLNAHPKVAECVVTSVEDTEEIIAAYVVKSDRSLEVSELDEYCREGMVLTEQKRPHLYRFKKVLPKTSNGKMQHKKAKQMAAADYKNGMFYKV